MYAAGINFAVVLQLLQSFKRETRHWQVCRFKPVFFRTYFGHRPKRFWNDRKKI